MSNVAGCVPASIACVHGYLRSSDRFPDHLRKKIELMERYRDAEPYVDPDFMWRAPGIDFYDLNDIGPGASPVTGQLDDV